MRVITNRKDKLDGVDEYLCCEMVRGKREREGGEGIKKKEKEKRQRREGKGEGKVREGSLDILT